MSSNTIAAPIPAESCPLCDTLRNGRKCSSCGFDFQDNVVKCCSCGDSIRENNATPETTYRHGRGQVTRYYCADCQDDRLAAEILD